MTQALDADLAEEDFKTLLHKTHFDPLVWAKIYTPNLVPLPYAHFHREWMQLATHKDRLAIAAPRGHAKSTLLTVIFPLWMAMEKKGTDILIISASEDMAAGWVRKIKMELEHNRVLRWKYSPQETGKWTELHIELKNGSTIRGIGAEAAIRGRRPDVVIIDDCESDEMVRSEARRDSFKDWFYSALIGTLKPNSKLIMIGTVLHIRSFLANTMNNPPSGWSVRLYRAIEHNQPLWPEAWSLQALMQRKAEIGSIQFSKEYENNPMPDDVAIYREPWMRPYDQLPCQEDALFIVGGVDIGVRAKEVNDPSAFVVYGRDPSTGKVYCLNHGKGRWTVYELIDRMLESQKRWPKMRWAIETVQAQYAVLQVFKQEAFARGFGYIQVDDYQVKTDKVTRARSNQGIFEQGLVHFRPTQRELVDQLLIFPQGDEDDLVDANSLAFLSLQEHFRLSPKSTETSLEAPYTWGQERSRLMAYVKMKQRYPYLDDVQAWLRAA